MFERPDISLELRKQFVWSKGRAIPNNSPALWRSDTYGNVMLFSDYGKTTDYGWEIDHILPTAEGGPDSAENLQPLHWRANRQKGDKLLWDALAAFATTAVKRD